MLNKRLYRRAQVQWLAVLIFIRDELHASYAQLFPPSVLSKGWAGRSWSPCRPATSLARRSGSVVDRLDAVAIIRSGSHMMENRWQMAMSYQQIRVRAAWMEERPLHRTSVGRCRFFLFFFSLLFAKGCFSWAVVGHIGFSGNLVQSPRQRKPNKIGGPRAEARVSQLTRSSDDAHHACSAGPQIVPFPYSKFRNWNHPTAHLMMVQYVQPWQAHGRKARKKDPGARDQSNLDEEQPSRTGVPPAGHTWQPRRRSANGTARVRYHSAPPRRHRFLFRFPGSPRRVVVSRKRERKENRSRILPPGTPEDEGISSRSRARDRPSCRRHGFHEGDRSDRPRDVRAAFFLLISSFLFSFKKDKDFWWTASSSFTLLFFFLLFYTQKEGGEPQGAQGAGNRAEGCGFLLLESALGLALIPRCFVVHRCFGLLDLFRIRSRGFWVLRFV